MGAETRHPGQHNPSRQADPAQPESGMARRRRIRACQRRPAARAGRLLVRNSPALYTGSSVAKIPHRRRQRPAGGEDPVPGRPATATGHTLAGPGRAEPVRAKPGFSGPGRVQRPHMLGIPLPPPPPAPPSQARRRT
jgi:hypothetical protein